MNNRMAVIAFLLGLLAVGMAAFQNNFAPAKPEPITEDKPRTLKEVAADAAKTILQEKVLHKESPPKPVKAPRLPLQPYQMVFTGLGVLAIGLGAYAWAQKAHTRLAAAAIGLGLIAIAWEWVVIAVGLAVLIFLLALLCS
jgi:hypothetical protein